MTIAYSSSELIDQYNRTSSGHFFDKNTMRFFKSKVTSEYRRLDDNSALFITSEVNPSGEKRWSLRLAKIVNKCDYTDSIKKIDIDTVGEFHSFDTKYQAVKAMKGYKQ